MIQGPQMIRIKICCIQSKAEARLAVQHGANAVGLVSEMPSGPGVISDAEIGDIAREVPPGVDAVLLTSLRSASDVIQQQRRTFVGAIQLCDELPLGDYAELRKNLPGIKLIQVVHVDGSGAVEEALAVAEYIDAILLDSGSKKGEQKELGGTGKTHDWSISAEIRKAVPVPIFLAGGLNSRNVGEAIAVVKPYGVDVCNGVRSHGDLDEAKLQAFMESVRGCTGA